MGAPNAFEHRRDALSRLKLTGGRGDPAEATDAEVAQSFVSQVSNPRSDFFQYLQLGCLCLRLGDVLFVHGGIDTDNVL